MVEATPPSEKTKSRKRPHSKVRTGCLTCKIRRVKCDETKPVCIRCSSFGRKCDGYSQWKPKELNLKTASSSSISTALPKSKQSTSPTSRSPVPLSIAQFTGSPEEIASFQYFCEKTVPLVDAICHTAFCRESVLVLCETNDTIRSLVLSVSSNHQSLSRPTQNAAKQRTFFYNHYNKALRHMIGITDPNIGIVITSCLLFAACDDLCGRGHSALRHIAAAFAILHTYKMKDKSLQDKASDEIIESYVGPVLELCKRRASLFKGNDIGGGPADYCGKVDLPQTFLSLDQARETLNNIILRHLYQYTDPWSPPDLAMNLDRLDDLNDLSSALLQWGHRINDLLVANSDNFDFDFKAVGSLQRIHGSIVSVIVKAALYPDEMEWDRYDIWRGMAQNLQPLIEGYIELVRYGQQEDLDNEPDLGFIPPLFLSATRCRDPQTRRSALQMLYKVRRVEGSWNSFFAAKVAETMINIEERGNVMARESHDIPRENRIRAVGVHLEEGTGAIMLSYLRYPYTTDIEVLECAVDFGESNGTQSLQEQVQLPLTKMIQSSGYQGLVQSRPLLKMLSP